MRDTTRNILGFCFIACAGFSLNLKADNGNGTEPPRDDSQSSQETPSALCAALPIYCEYLDIINDNGNGTEPPADNGNGTEPPANNANKADGVDG